MSDENEKGFEEQMAEVAVADGPEGIKRMNEYYRQQAQNQGHGPRKTADKGSYAAFLTAIHEDQDPGGGRLADRLDAFRSWFERKQDENLTDEALFRAHDEKLQQIADTYYNDVQKAIGEIDEKMDQARQEAEPSFSGDIEKLDRARADFELAIESATDEELIERATALRSEEAYKVPPTLLRVVSRELKRRNLPEHKAYQDFMNHENMYDILTHVPAGRELQRRRALLAETKRGEYVADGNVHFDILRFGVV